MKSVTTISIFIVGLAGWSHHGCWHTLNLRIRRLYNKDQEVIPQGSGGYTTRIRRLCFPTQFFFLDIFIFLLLFGVFSCLKTLFLDFHQEKLFCNKDIEMPFCTTPPLLTRPTKFCKKNLEMMKNTFFMYLNKTILKHFAKKSVSEFNGVWRHAIEYTKTFFSQMFYHFFFIKLFQDFFNKIVLVL